MKLIVTGDADRMNVDDSGAPEEVYSLITGLLMEDR